MKTAALLLASALLLPAASAFAQSFTFTAPEADLQELVGCHSAVQAVAQTTGKVTYFGVVNSHDAQHEQFARLRQVFEASKPTVVLFEKPDAGVAGTEAATIAQMGESGYARYLAQQHGARAERLDDPVAEYEYLRAHADATQLKLYYLLRVSQQFRHCTGASHTLTKKHMQQMLASSPFFLPGTDNVLQDMAGFRAAYCQHCPTGGKWWKRSLDAQPTEAFMQRFDDELRDFRAQRLAQQIARHTQADERVLVVLDRSHLPASVFFAASTRASR